MEQTSEQFQQHAREAMAKQDARERRDLLGVFLPATRDAAVAELGDFEALREHVRLVKDHTLDNLDHYLRQFEEQVVLNGGHVHWARDSEELNSIVLDICRRRDARRVGKGKSMITEIVKKHTNSPA